MNEQITKTENIERETRRVSALFCSFSLIAGQLKGNYLLIQYVVYRPVLDEL